MSPGAIAVLSTKLLKTAKLLLHYWIVDSPKSIQLNLSFWILGGMKYCIQK